MTTFPRNFWSRARLYLVLDTSVQGPQAILETAKEAVRFGVDVVQLRNKLGTDREFFALTCRLQAALRGRAPLIVNDRLDIALAAKAAGVHVGQDDMPLRELRRLAGRQLWVGLSCQTLVQARKAKEDGADYIGLGSVFSTKTKPDRDPMDLRLLRRVVRAVDMPVFAIGGITPQNIDTVLAAGGERVAVTRAISLAPSVAEAVKIFRQKLTK